MAFVFGKKSGQLSSNRAEIPPLNTFDPSSASIGQIDPTATGSAADALLALARFRITRLVRKESPRRTRLERHKVPWTGLNRGRQAQEC